ncbi:MAG: HNH endonuclease signature motif containing protein [Caldilineaceae bacterium]
MTAHVSAALRRLVIERARERCEYCLLPQGFATHAHEPDHIVPTQHDGTTDEDNLALACFRCNRNKGPNVGSFDPMTGELTSFFHPRKHTWAEHFYLREAEIVTLTAEARVTIKILGLNAPDRIAERRQLLQMGVYPSIDKIDKEGTL